MQTSPQSSLSPDIGHFKLTNKNTILKITDGRTYSIRETLQMPAKPHEDGGTQQTVVYFLHKIPYVAKMTCFRNISWDTACISLTALHNEVILTHQVGLAPSQKLYLQGLSPEVEKALIAPSEPTEDADNETVSSATETKSTEADTQQPTYVFNTLFFIKKMTVCLDQYVANSPSIDPKKRCSADLWLKITRLFLEHLQEQYENKHILNRDIKPANMGMVYEAGQIKTHILDLGSGFKPGVTEDAYATMLLTTPVYCAPEIPEAYSPSSEIFSLTLSLLQILAGCYYPEECQSLFETDIFNKIPSLFRDAVTNTSDIRYQTHFINPMLAKAQRELILHPEVMSALTLFIQKGLAPKAIDRYSNAASALAEFDILATHYHSPPSTITHGGQDTSTAPLLGTAPRRSSSWWNCFCCFGSAEMEDSTVPVSYDSTGDVPYPLRM
jgi:hypothetical protein